MRLPSIARGFVAVVVCGLLVAAASGWPMPPRLDEAWAGDAALAGQVRAALGDGRGYQRVAVAVLDQRGVRYAAVGGDGNGRAADEHTQFEIGSVAKPMTALLLAQHVSRKTLSYDMTLSQVPRLGSVGRPLGDVTLRELALHISGLPRGARSGGDGLRGGLRYVAFGSDPYDGAQPTDVVTAASEQRLQRRGWYRYSNLGYGLLGAALSAAADRPLPDLLESGVWQPLGMRSTTAVGCGGSEYAPTKGFTANGRRMAPWRACGYTGAGSGVWSTTHDLALWLRALHGGRVLGHQSVSPGVGAPDGSRIALGWSTRPAAESTLRHAGGTGGFRSYVSVDLQSGRGVVVLSNTSAPVAELGQALLAGVRSPPESPRRRRAYQLLAVTLLALAPILAPPRRRWPVPAAVLVCGLAATGLATITPWQHLPPQVQTAVQSLTVMVALVAMWRWSVATATLRMRGPDEATAGPRELVARCRSSM